MRTTGVISEIKLVFATSLLHPYGTHENCICRYRQLPSSLQTLLTLLKLRDIPTTPSNNHCRCLSRALGGPTRVDPPPNVDGRRERMLQKLLGARCKVICYSPRKIPGPETDRFK
ncbi:hypothetical protein AVEN_165076-1 [Araneus ventricosus]|uniref:Uncharacterized protein n=1 Tax=Araneus ventricosus TaxID=182803 RepID=A0A4Y2F686_ARAVE|nr:hypothetical protein AVEN_165076-1 [Araneus ventricosus]